MIAALLAGQVDYGTELLLAVQGQVQAGKLKILGVATPQRWSVIQNVATVAEQGVPGYEVLSWYGWVYPAGTPKAIVDRTNAALKEVLSRPVIREQLAKAGALANISSPESFGAQISAEVAKWKMVRDKAGIQPN